jgi:hypothetical protein
MSKPALVCRIQFHSDNLSSAQGFCRPRRSRRDRLSLAPMLGLDSVWTITDHARALLTGSLRIGPP